MNENAKEMVAKHNNKQKEEKMYDPAKVERISTKKMSSRALYAKPTLIIKLAKLMEQNENWNLTTTSSLEYARKLVEKMYNVRHF